jgi:hypothetical protein
VAVARIHRKAAIRLRRRAAPIRQGRAALRAPAAVWPRRGRRRGGAVADGRAHRRPSPAALRAGAARSPRPVWRTPAGARGGQAPAPRQCRDAGAAARARPGALPRARGHHDPAGHLAQARDPDPHLHRLG